MINVFSGDLIESKNIQNLLESENIEVFAVNQYMSSIEPWALTAGGFNPVTLKVNDVDFEKAKKIVEDYVSGILEIDKKNN
jgi:hypothetical protein